MTFFEMLDTANNGLSAYRKQMEIASQNIANATTPGYKKQEAILGETGNESFALVMARELGIKESDLKNIAAAGGSTTGGVGVVKIIEDRTPGQRVHMPGHPMADKDGYVEMSNVDTLKEMLDMMYAVRNYKANLSIVEMVKSSAKETLNIGKPGG